MITTTAMALTVTLSMSYAAAPPPATSSASSLSIDEAKEKNEPKKSDEAFYRKATKAIDDERWNDAVDLLQKSISSEPSRADRALYWLGYAQNKSGRAADALATLQKLHQKFPSSKWNDDAKALELEIRQSTGQHIAPEALGDDDLKLLAISSLLNSDQDRAITLLDKILRSNSSSEVKERALFVLSQSDSPKALPMIESIARGGSGRELQEKALQLLGTTSSPSHRKLLLDVLQKTNDPETKSAAMQGLMVAGDRQSIFSVASTDPSADVREEATKLLGVLHATAELDRLYQTEKVASVKESIIQAYFIAGEIGRLTELVRTEKNQDLRIEAIRSIGASGGKSGDQLLQLWNTESDPDVKEAILDGLFIQGNAHALVNLARKEQNRELKRAIVERLAHLSNKEAHDYMMEILNQ